MKPTGVNNDTTRGKKYRMALNVVLLNSLGRIHQLNETSVRTRIAFL